MKIYPLLAASLAFAVGMTPISSPAQDAPPPPTGPIALKPEQVSNVLKQLEELERTILSQRGTNLSAIIQKIRSAAASDAAALNLIADCDKVVNVDRKADDREAKEQAEKREEQQKRKQEPDKEDEKKNGDANLALRLSLEYLALTLEANEAKDIATMVPKLQTFHQSLLASAPKLKGAAGEMLRRGGGGGGGGGGGRRGGGGGPPAGAIGLIVSAFQLEPYLNPPNWSRNAGDVIDHFDKVQLKIAKAKKPEEIPALWDTAINLEASIRKESMYEGEYNLWVQTEVPLLKWKRAEDMVQYGQTPITGLAEMLNIIKTYPNHPDSPKWVERLRSLVKPEETPASSESPGSTGAGPTGTTDGTGAGK